MTPVTLEVQVICYKHIFSEHLVFQFQCTNTIAEQILENVSVQMESLSEASGFRENVTVPLVSMPLSQAGSTFVSFSHEEVRGML